MQLNTKQIIKDTVILIALMTILQQFLQQIIGVLPQYAAYISIGIGAVVEIIYFANLILTVFNELNTNIVALREELRKG